MPQSRIAIAPFMIGSVAVSISMTWVYNSTGGSGLFIAYQMLSNPIYLVLCPINNFTKALELIED